MPLSDDLQTIPRLVGDAVDQLGKLVQNEVQLAKAELSEKASQVGVGVAYIGGAAVLAIPVVVMLLIAIAMWLTQWGLSPPVAHLASAGLGAVLCAILASVGAGYLKPANLKPKATMQELQRNSQAAKELVR